jgi:NAD(P)H-dependent FMN reductase
MMATIEAPHVGIIVGSTRQGRFGDKPANWIHGIASQRTDFTIELVDLRDYPMPFFNEPTSPAWAPVTDELGSEDCDARRPDRGLP